jgi:uncharacterized protein
MIPSTGGHALALNDAELRRLDELLASANEDEAMTLEEFDGFTAATLTSPVPIAPDELLGEILGGPPDEVQAQLPADDYELLMRLLKRHRDNVAHQLHDGEGFSPVLAYDDAERVDGRGWAIGYLRGVGLNAEDWTPLDDDDDFADILDPMVRLADEFDPDTGELHEAIPIDERPKLVEEMISNAMDAFAFFMEARERALVPATVRRDEPKVGRNDPCPCGSGRKYKNCHGGQ